MTISEHTEHCKYFHFRLYVADCHRDVVCWQRSNVQVYLVALALSHPTKGVCPLTVDKTLFA